MGQHRKKSTRRLSAPPSTARTSGMNRFDSLDITSNSVSVSRSTSRCQSYRSRRSHQSRNSGSRQLPIAHQNTTANDTIEEIFQEHLSQFQHHLQENSPYTFTDSQKFHEIHFRHATNSNSFLSVDAPLGLFLEPDHDALDDLSRSFYSNISLNIRPTESLMILIKLFCLRLLKTIIVSMAVQMEKVFLLSVHMH